jgi:transposase IS66-like protein/transposase
MRRQRPGASVSEVARRYGIAARLLFRWKQEFSAPDPVFVSVAVADGAPPEAVVASLLAAAGLVEPFAYLKDVLERLSNSYPKSRLDELLPWNWAQVRAAA